jgi:hypothetical protein
MVQKFMKGWLVKKHWLKEVAITKIADTSAYFENIRLRFQENA